MTIKKHDPLRGLEASRKTGWAKYYEAIEELEESRRLLKRLAEGVLYDPRLRVDDHLVIMAQAILGAIRK